MVGRFPNETSALVMVFSLLEEEKVKWQKVTIRAEDIAWIEEVSKDVGARANQTGILRGSTGYLKGLTAMTNRGQDMTREISTSYGAQP